MSSAQPHFAGDYGAEDKFEKLDTWLTSAVDIKSGGVLVWGLCHALWNDCKLVGLHRRN